VCVLCLSHRPGSRALAAGVTWTLVIASAPWAARGYHTTVIDAAGAIYVIGGLVGYTLYKDVWVSTDGGARPDSRRACRGVLGGSSGYSRGTEGVVHGYYRST
jgi:hypothetical protein